MKEEEHAGTQTKRPSRELKCCLQAPTTRTGILRTLKALTACMHQRLKPDECDAGIRCAEDLLELDAGDLEDEVVCMRERVHDKAPTVPAAIASECPAACPRSAPRG